MLNKTILCVVRLLKSTFSYTSNNPDMVDLEIDLKFVEPSSVRTRLYLMDTKTSYIKNVSSIGFSLKTKPNTILTEYESTDLQSNSRTKTSRSLRVREYYC